MKVSFIIVALNAEESISYSLNSLVMQDYPHGKIEVILVDGLSIDRTKDLMRDFAEVDNGFEKVLVLDNPKKILAAGWNVALKEVTGDIVLRVDAHTKFPSDFISKNVECISSGKDICGGKVISILEKDTQLNRLLLEAENSMFGGGFTFFRRGEVARYTNTLAFAAYRKEVFDRVGKYDERLVRTEDNEMHYRMRKAGFKFFFDPAIQSCRFCRSSFKKLLKQKYLNGYWVGLTMGIAPKAFSIFYIVPLLFLIALVFCILFCIVSPILLILLLSAYGLVLLLAFVFAIIKDKFYPALLLLPFVIFCLHVVYGTGTLVGVIKSPSFFK